MQTWSEPELWPRIMFETYNYQQDMIGDRFTSILLFDEDWRNMSKYNPKRDIMFYGHNEFTTSKYKYSG